MSIHIGVSSPSATSKQPSEPSKIKIFQFGVIMVFFSTRYKKKPSRDNTDAPTFSEFLAFLVGNFFVLDFHWDWFYVYRQCCTFLLLHCTDDLFHEVGEAGQTPWNPSTVTGLVDTCLLIQHLPSVATQINNVYSSKIFSSG